jgi:hypothetical protein
VTAERIRLTENLQIGPYRRSQRAGRHHHTRQASPTVTMSLKPAPLLGEGERAGLVLVC